MKARTKWTVEGIRAEALKFSTRSEFQNNSLAYKAALRRNILDDVCIHMEMKNIYWTQESIRTESLKYETKAEFKYGSPKAYATAVGRKFLNDGITCSHLKAEITYWDNALIRAEALRFKTRGDFKMGSPSAYAAARKRNVLDDVCSHMESNLTYWDTASIKEEALKYSVRCEFKKNCPGAYSAARKKGIIGEVCGHMQELFNKWTDDLIRIEASHYRLRSDFKKRSKAYSAAQDRGLIDDVCKHMDYGMVGFRKDKPATLYYVKFCVASDLSLYKVGITNRAVGDRLRGMNINNGVTASVIKEIWFENGAEAYNLEQLLHQEFKEQRYLGDNILGNGNTELYVTDVLHYDTKQHAA